MEKETDEISDLREEYVKSANKPLMYKEKLVITDGSENKIIANMNKGFTDNEIAVLQKYKLPSPSEILINNMKDGSIARQIMDKSGQINKQLGQQKGHLSITRKDR